MQLSPRRGRPPSRAVHSVLTSPRPSHVMDVANDLALSAWIEGGGSLEAASDGGATVLMGAAASGNLKLVKELLAKGCAVNQQDPTTKRTALMAACSGNGGGTGGGIGSSGAGSTSGVGSSSGVGGGGVGGGGVGGGGGGGGGGGIGDGASLGPGGPQPQVARLLLEHGAKSELRSAEGRTALDELADATRSRVLGPLEFIRVIECTKVVAGHQQALEEAGRLPPKLEGQLTRADELAFDAWVRRVDHEQVALLKLCEENRRRGLDHEGKLTGLVSEASGRNLIDRTKDAAAALKRGRTRALERNLRGMGLL
jgi:hypothetical protein